MQPLGQPQDAWSRPLLLSQGKTCHLQASEVVLPLPPRDQADPPVVAPCLRELSRGSRGSSLSLFSPAGRRAAPLFGYLGVRGCDVSFGGQAEPCIEGPPYVVYVAQRAPSRAPVL